MFQTGQGRVRAEVSPGRPGLKLSARCCIDVGVQLVAAAYVLSFCQVSTRTAINFRDIVIDASLQTTGWRSVSVSVLSDIFTMHRRRLQSPSVKPVQFTYVTYLHRRDRLK